MEAGAGGEIHGVTVPEKLRSGNPRAIGGWSGFATQAAAIGERLIEPRIRWPSHSEVYKPSRFKKSRFNRLETHGPMIDHRARFAATIEEELIPFLQSLETYLAEAGFSAARFSSYTELRKWFGGAAKSIRSGGRHQVLLADGVLMKLDELQTALPVVLAHLPVEFSRRWKALAEQLEKDNPLAGESGDPTLLDEGAPS